MFLNRGAKIDVLFHFILHLHDITPRETRQNAQHISILGITQ